MPGPIIAYNNLFSLGTIVPNSGGSGTDDMAYPRNRVFNRLISKPWRSRHATVVIDTSNNKIDFSITSGGGSPLVATLTSGTYRFEEAAAEAANKMNAAAAVTDIKVTYSGGFYTFSKGAGVFFLKWATGANKNNSAGPTFGFLGAADKTGSLSYTSDDESFSTGGLYTITSSNNKLYYNDGTSRTATIPSATYNTKGLSAEMKFQIDTTSTITNSFGYWGQSKLKWILGRQSGTFQLTTSNTTNAIWDLLGYTTGADKTGAQSYIAERQRIHSEEGLVIDLASATNITFVAISGINLASAAAGGTFSLLLQGNATDSWTSPTFSSAPTEQSLNQATQKGWAYWTLNQTFRFWRIKIINNDNSQGFVQIGHLFGGNSYTMTKNYDRFHEQTKFAITEKGITDLGAVYGEKKATLFEMKMEFKNGNILQADKNFLDTLLDTVEDIIPFYIVLPFPLTTPRLVYAVFSRRPTFIEQTFEQGGGGNMRWNCNDFVIREAG